MTVSVYAHPDKNATILMVHAEGKVTIDFDGACVTMNEDQLRALVDLIEKHLNKELIDG